MSVKHLEVHIDREIARLREALELLREQSPRGTSKTGAKTAPKKGTMSLEGRKRISEAMRKRWSQRRRAANSKSAK